MERFAYIQIDGFCILILLLVLVTLFRHIDKPHRKKLFIMLLIASSLLFLADMLWAMQDAGVIHLSRGWQYLVYSVYFLQCSTVGYVMLLYSEHENFRSKGNGKWISVLSAVPLLTVLLLIVGNYWSKWIFSIDGHNVYRRGRQYYIHLLVAFGYIVIAALRALIRACRKEEYASRKQNLTLATFAVFPLLTGVLQMLIPAVSLLSPGLTISILSVFFGMLQEQISMDPLTLMNNRSRLLFYLSDRIMDRDAETNMNLIRIRIANLRQVRDVFGEDAEEQVMKRISEILKGVAHNHRCFLSRSAKDEFAVVFSETGRINAELFLRSVCKEIDTRFEKMPYSLDIRVGYQILDASVDGVKDWMDKAHTTKRGETDADTSNHG